SLLLTSIAPEEPLRLHLPAELGVEIDQRPGDPQAERPRLAVDAPAGDRRDRVGVLVAPDRTERGLRDHPVDARREVVLERPAVDLELALPRDESHACHGLLATTGRELRGCRHLRLLLPGGTLRG